MKQYSPEHLRDLALLCGGVAVILVAAVFIAPPSPSGSAPSSFFSADFQNLNFSPEGLAAATWLGYYFQGIPQYEGAWPLPHYCEVGYGGHDNAGPDCYRDGISGPPEGNNWGGHVKIAVFSAHQQNVGQGTSGLLYASAYSAPNGNQVCGWVDKSYVCNPEYSLHVNYSQSYVGSAVSIPSGSPLSLEWACQNNQTVQFRACGGMWNECNNYYAGNNYVTSSSGANFSTGGGLVGSTVVNPTQNTTYTLTCAPAIPAVGGGFGGTVQGPPPATITVGTPTLSIAVTVTAPPPPPPAPTGLTGSCNVQGTQGTLNWTPVAGATGYYIRVDNTANPFAPTACNGAPNDGNTGDICTPPIGGVPPYTFTSIVGASYNTWVHSNNANGYSAPTYVAFTCTLAAAPTATISAGAGNDVDVTVTQGSAPVPITATFAVASGDTLTNSNIDQPQGTGRGSPGWATPGNQSYSFNPTTVGSYTFYAMAATAAYPSAAPYKDVVVTVTAADICTDIPGTQPTPPPGCQNPTPSPGICIPSGYSWDGSQCVLAPTITSFLATPTRVRKGDPASLSWNVTNAPVSCAVTSSPIISGFPATVSTFPQGSLSTGAINQRTTFTMSCGTAPSSQATVTIVPEVKEI